MPALASRLPPFLYPDRGTPVTDSLREPPMIARGTCSGRARSRAAVPQADGGDIELVAVVGNSAAVRLTGACAGCPSAHMTLHVGIETALREEIPDFDTLRVA